MRAFVARTPIRPASRRFYPSVRLTIPSRLARRRHRPPSGPNHFGCGPFDRPPRPSVVAPNRWANPTLRWRFAKCPPFGWRRPGRRGRRPYDLQTRRFGHRPGRRATSMMRRSIIGSVTSAAFRPKPAIDPPNFAAAGCGCRVADAVAGVTAAAPRVLIASVPPRPIECRFRCELRLTIGGRRPAAFWPPACCRFPSNRPRQSSTPRPMPTNRCRRYPPPTDLRPTLAPRPPSWIAIGCDVPSTATTHGLSPATMTRSPSSAGSNGVVN